MCISRYLIDSVSLENPIIEAYSFSLLGTLRIPTEEPWAILDERPERERENSSSTSFSSFKHHAEKGSAILAIMATAPDI